MTQVQSTKYKDQTSKDYGRHNRSWRGGIDLKLTETSGEHLSQEDFERLALSETSRGRFMRSETDTGLSQESHDAWLTKALRHIEICDVCRK